MASFLTPYRSHSAEGGNGEIPNFGRWRPVEQEPALPGEAITSGQILDESQHQQESVLCHRRIDARVVGHRDVGRGDGHEVGRLVANPELLD